MLVFRQHVAPEPCRTERREVDAMTSVLVVDDHDLMRSSLSRLIEAEPDLVLLGTACDGRSGVDLAALLRPDVVLMDMALPDLDGIDATREVLRDQPEARVLILSSSCRGPVVREALRAGACGYLLKGDPPDVLMDGIRLAARGGEPLTPLVRDLSGR
jgi:DNA-binding NarL/FixJ family response regulator